MLLDLKQLSVETLGVYLKDFNCAFKSIGHLCKAIYITHNILLASN